MHFDNSPPSVPEERTHCATLKRIARGRPIACAAAVLLAYALLLRLYFVPAIAHPDANGYWAQGSLLMKTGRAWFRPESNVQYIGMHWLLTPNDVYISRYPPGLAVLIGLVWKLFGWKASVLVNPVLAVLSLWGVFLIVRRLASEAYALFAMLALAINPAFTVHALTNISHMPVAFCLIWGVVLLQKWSEDGRLRHAFAAGLILGCIPTIRYADSIMALGVAAFLLLHWRRFPRIHLHYLAAILGAAIPIVPLLMRNQALLGAFWRTGYALTNEQSGFGWDYFKQHALGYLASLQSAGLGMLFVLGLVGIVWMTMDRRRRATGLLLLLSSTPLLLVYMAYYWAQGINGRGPGHGGGALRFLVPLMPTYVVAAAWALSQAVRSAPRAARVAIPAIVIVVQALISVPDLLQELREQYDRKTVLALATEGIEQVAKPGDVVVAGQGFLQQFDFVREWKLADASVIRGAPGGLGPGRRMRNGYRERQPGAPSPMQADARRRRSSLYQGTTESRQSQFVNDLLEWAGRSAIYVVGSEDELTRLLPGATAEYLTIVKRIPTPQPPRNRQLADGPDRPDRAALRGGRPPDLNDPRRRGGGMFGPAIPPGEDIVIARWD